MQENVPSHLIDKYLRGECSVEEEKVIVDWYNSVENTDPISLLTEKQQRNLKSKMFARIKAQAFGDNARVPGRSVATWIYAAASIAAIFILYFALNRGPASQVEKLTGIPVTKQMPSRIRFTNNLSKLYKYTLPDNSVVWLKPGASMKFDRTFVQNTREVELEGEAFFDVTKDPKRPFLISSGAIVTKVLGTSFNIRSVAGEAEVAVVTGEVLVYTKEKGVDKKSVYLLPEQRATFKAAGNRLEKKLKHLPAMQIWEKETLSFDNITVSEIVDTLNKKFDARIQLEEPVLGSYRVKADFTDVNLPTILELLCKSINKEYELRGSTIMILN